MMVALVIGVPDSGKSALAEDLALKLSGDNKRIYLATMEILDEEGKRRVEKHRRLRDGKGFFTIEAPIRAWDAVSKAEDLADATVLIECISNLVGNVMHDRTGLIENRTSENIVKTVFDDVAKICEKAGNVVIVTNSFAASDDFDDETLEYISCLDKVNYRLRSLADEVYEFTEGEWVRSEDN